MLVGDRLVADKVGKRTLAVSEGRLASDIVNSVVLPFRVHF